MKNRKLKKLTSVIMSLMAGTLALSSAGYTVANAQRANLDQALGTTSYKMVTDEAAAAENLYNFDAIKGKVVGADGKEISYDTSTLKGMLDYQKDVSMRLAEESAVLLKNDNNVLPMTSEASRKNITLLGSRSYMSSYEYMQWGMKFTGIGGTQFGGLMGSIAPAGECVSIEAALEKNGFTVNKTVANAYQTYMADKANIPDPVFNGKFQLNESNPTDIGLEGLKNSFGSTAIVTVGRPAAESRYYLPGAAGKADATEFAEGTDVLGLSKDELATLQFAKENFDKVIVFINAVQMDIPELGDYADAIMWVGLPGAYGFEAIAKVLNGTIAPSGSLSDTFAAQASKAIAMVNTQYSFQSGNGITIDNNVYTNEFYAPEMESIYTGYRYYESRYYDTVVNAHNARGNVGTTAGASTWNYNNEVVYPYGYGMSYTTFSESAKISVDAAASKVNAQVEVKNTGSKYAGKHTVQLYVQTPYSEDGVEKSAIQLIGFAKTDILQPGETQTVTISCDYQDFASWDRDFEHNAVKGGYILDAGDYYFTTANGANEAVNNVLAAQGYKANATDGYMTADGDASKVTTIDLSRVEITKSKAGEMLQNQLDNMDLEVQIDGVKNFSRADWVANWPKEYKDLTPSANMKDALMNQAYTLNANGDPSTVKFGQDYGMTYADLKPAKGEKLSYDDPRLQKFVEQYDLGDAIAQIINGDSNSMGATTVSGKEKAQPFLYPSDGPMGFDGSANAALGSTRLPENSPFNAKNDPDFETLKDKPMRTLPTGVNIGSTWNAKLNEEAGVMLGQCALWNSVNVLQGPGSNTHRNAYNSRNHEYYSEDGLHSGLMMQAFCKGAWEQGLITTVKHFAFNDTELNRMGVSAYMSEQRAREIELRAFQCGIESGDVVGMMMGMNRAGSYFIGANPGIMNIIRKEWGFHGVIVTDMTKGTYDNNRDAVAAGVDSMLHAITANKAAPGRDELLKEWAGDVQYATGTPQDIVTKDTYFLTRVQEALKHMTWAMVNSNIMNGVNGSTRNVRVLTFYDKAFISVIAVSGVLTAAAVAGNVVLTLRSKKEEE